MPEQSELIAALAPVLHSSFKVDVFVSQRRAFDLVAQERAVQAKLGDPPFLNARIASVEDIILIKLQWYRLGDEVSERQWNDLTTVVQLNRMHLDQEYLLHWAKILGVDVLLMKLLNRLA